MCLESNIDNAIFVGYKPAFISSNAYLSRIKRHFSIKKMGYSGTLDPFASGCLVIATKSYTKLLSHLDLTPKVYKATLWLGATSDSLDITNVSDVILCKPFDIDFISDVLHSLKGKLTYTPPIFSAKKINGMRAYKIARNNGKVLLNDITMDIFDISLVSYNHPFLNFYIKVSKGAYIRSVGSIIAKKLGVNGVLSNLIRISEGSFSFDNYRMLDPLAYINYDRLDSADCCALKEEFCLGKKIINNKLLLKYKSGRYIANFDNFFSIIDINHFGNVDYILNRIPKC